VDLNHERMQYKGIRSGIDDEYCKRIFQYVQKRGCLCVCLVNGEVIGGTINYIIDEDACLHVIAHSNLYNKYNVGQIVLVNTIQYLIERKVKRFHLLWGSHEYKDRFLCVRYSLYKIVIFKQFDIQYVIQRSIFKVMTIKNKLKQKLKKCRHFFK
jgi:hypothetical protein